MKFLWNHSDRLSHFATILTFIVALLTFIVALFAVVVAGWQIASSNRSQQEATAQETYREYLKLAIEQPELADGITDPEPTAHDLAKYGWFVSYFLHSAEQIYLLFPDDNEWAQALSSQICQHSVYLSSSDFQNNYKSHYNPSFQRFLDTALTRCETKTSK